VIQPTLLDLRIIRLLISLETKPIWVEAIEILSQSPFANGLVYAIPLFLLWDSNFVEQRRVVDRTILTILIGTIIGVLGSLTLRQGIRRPAPASHPILASVYAPAFREYFRVHPNPNSFPSDSAMLYSTVAFGFAGESHLLAASLLAWLILVVAPAKIFVGGHYPTDIAAGVLLGLCHTGSLLGRWSSTPFLTPSSSPFDDSQHCDFLLALRGRK
jgi:membrane-associated phospholipid phosphatase